MRAIILGCGPNCGVPTMLGDWGKCDPKEPRNKRTRTSLFIENEEASVIIDTGPDVRFQALREGITKLDAVFYTHAHADHINGIMDLKIAARHMGWKKMPIYASEKTLLGLKQSVPFAFQPEENAPDHHYAFLEPHIITPQMQYAGMGVYTFELPHGPTNVTGYRFDDLGYTTDLSDMTAEAFDILKGIKVWVVSCLTDQPTSTHAGVSQIIEWVERIKPERTILTHMNPVLDYKTLRNELPKGIEPGYDGMVIEV